MKLCFAVCFPLVMSGTYVLRITHENIFNRYSEFQIELSFSQTTSPQKCQDDQTIYLLKYLFLPVTETLRAWSQMEISGSGSKSRTLTWFNAL